MTMQTIEIDGKTLVLLTKEAFDEIMEKAGILPPLPPKTQRGNYPAIEACDVLIARKIISRRIKAGWTQKELAKRSGIRLETISRLEGAKHSPTRETITRIDSALAKAGV